MDPFLLQLINRQWTGPALDRLMAAASSFDLWLPFIVLAVALTAWFGRARARWFLVVLALALVVDDGLVCGPLKHAIHRLRPYQAMAGVRQVDLARHARPRVLALFQPLKISVTEAPMTLAPGDPFPGRSFPSSHVANNFCAAAVLAYFYRWRGAWYFLPAALVAYSRIYTGAHWPSDVLISAVLGAGVALCVLAGTQGAVGAWRKNRSRKPGAGSRTATRQVFETS